MKRPLEMPPFLRGRTVHPPGWSIETTFFTIWYCKRLHAHHRNILCFAAENESDNQSVNSDSFRERQADEHIGTNERLRLRVAANGVERLTGGDTNTNARADSTKTNCQSYTNQIHDKTSSKGKQRTVKN